MVAYPGTVIRASDFHSLRRAILRGDRWVDRVVLTKRDFQAGHPTDRFVSEIHSLDPESGAAIIKVGENDLPRGSRIIKCYYSWRKWNLEQNAEMAVLQRCKSPVDRYEPRFDA